MAAYLLVNQRLAIGVSSGTLDMTGEYAAATPNPVGIIDTRDLAGRDTPARHGLQVDLSYELAGFLDMANNKTRQIHAAWLASEIVELLEYQLDAKHWWMSHLLIPESGQENDGLFTFGWTMPSTGEKWSHGELLDGELTTAQAVTGVPDHALGMLYIKDVGTLTSLTLRYTASGTQYEMTISSPAVGITVERLETSANTPIPSTRPAGNMTIIPTPANASYELVAGFGAFAF